ncbi:MAG: ATP-binding protein, partial [Anaerolineae bacterium]
QKELVEAIEQVGGGQPLNKLTLGKLVGLYRASRAYQDLEKTLGLSLTFLNINALGPLVDIRNRAVHEGHEPDPAEAAYIVNQVELILRETGRLPQPSSHPAAQPSTPWWHTAIPHRDIREGRLDLKVFAVDLSQVLAEKAVPEYQDADTFFRRTFLTRGLQSTLKGVLRRLAGRDDGIAITQMATVFGGGKTHTLLALYHIVAHGAEVDYLEPVQGILKEAGLDAVPPARVAAVDCAYKGIVQPHTTPEGLTLHTLWGEIAYRLGQPDRGPEFYEIVRQDDEARAAPGSETLGRLFQAAGPSLILIDETLSYITKATAIRVGKGYLSDQAQEFLLELTRAANAADDVALVLTMTSSEQEQFGETGARAAEAQDTANRIQRRTRQVEVSAEREELYEILRRRLFDTPPEQIEAQARGTARAYWDYYRAHPGDFPQEAQAPEYRDLMVRAYPFHPALIEILRDRWGSISGFQRTRGVLRLLALVIADLYQQKHPAPLIQPAHVNLDDGKIRAELLGYVDNRGGYESAIFSDIGGTGESKAPYLDRITGGDYARHRIATGLATSIFMYSHSGATQQPASAERPQLWLSTLQPGIVPALAADALDKLRQRLWYMAVDEGTYRIDSQPNLNQMLVSRVDAIRQEPEMVRDRIREAVEEVVGRRVFPELIIWPEGPAQVPNRRALTLVVLDLPHAWDSDEKVQQAAQTFIEKVLNSAGNTFRQFKNTLVFLLPTADGV